MGYSAGPFYISLLILHKLLRNKIEADDSRQRHGLKQQAHGVVTLHRPVNVDHIETLAVLVDQLKRAAAEIPLVFAVHPRTRKQLQAFNLLSKLEAAPGLTLVEPQGYIQFMNLVLSARLVITDSGGIQEETTYLNIPCLTLRDTTERPITITQGTNRLVRAEHLLENVEAILNGGWNSGSCPELWDGRAASRLVHSLRQRTGAA